MKNEITTTTSPFQSLESFETAQRMARVLTSSDLFPERYRGDDNLGNALIALDMAQRMNMNPLAVCQHLYIVHGQPAWSAQFMIAMFNQSKQFGPIHYEMNDDNTACRALSTDLSTGKELRGPQVTMEMAEAEGWTGKRGSKWKTMPEHMLRLRSATFLIRSTAPELAMGLQTVEEVRDIIDITPAQEAEEGLAGVIGADTLPESNLTADMLSEAEEAGRRG